MHFDACQPTACWTRCAKRTGQLPADVVVAGCEAHVCLLQTTLGLLRAGLKVWVVADACGSRSPTTTPGDAPPAQAPAR
jgi:hypothetical protein